MMEKQLGDALATAERHMNAAHTQKDIATEMIYSVVVNKIREALFEIQQNLALPDVLSAEEGTVLVL